MRFYLPLRHEAQKAALVLGPGSAVLSIRIQQVLRGGQQRLMRVADAAKLRQKVRKVTLFRKTRKLRGAMQAHIQQALDPGLI